MKKSIFEVQENKALTENVYKMLLTGDTSAITAPGQFVNIQIDGFYLRRPISVCDVFGDQLTLIYKTVGSGTSAMSKMKAGTKLDLLTGLGNGYDMSLSGDMPLLIGGGVGVPPMYLLAKLLRRQDKHVKVILGFNTKDEIFYQEEFRRLGCEVLVTTVDGSEGIKGFVTDAFPVIAERAAVKGCGQIIRPDDTLSLDEAGIQNIKEAEKAEAVGKSVSSGDEANDGCGYSYVYACGPEPMLKAIYNAVKTSAQFSFEERMGCGFGACMGCSCKTVTGYKRICKDGPVLLKDEIIW